MFVSFSLAEICSAFPSAGSVYHWSGQLVPIRWTPLISYICGWTNFLGNAAGDASFAAAWAAFLDAALIASGRNESLSVAALVFISIAVLLVWSLLNIIRIDQLGWVNNIAAGVQFSSTFIIAIFLLSFPSKLSTGKFVFTEYYNLTGFESKSYVGAISLLAALYSFSGYEASAHMAEETTSARTSAPLGIIWTCFASGCGGLVLLLCLLFATDDVDAAVHGETDNGAINVFLRACGHDGGAFLAWLVVINVFFAGVSSVTVTGRITFALARDKAFPFSDRIATVHPVLKSPAVAIMFVWALDSLLQLLPLVSTVAFVSVTGITTIGFQISYAIPILMKLLCKEHFPLTKLSLGCWSKPIGLLSSLWLISTSFLFFLPTTNPVTRDNMNYTVLIVGAVVVAGTINWIFNAKYFFTGPKRVFDEKVPAEIIDTVIAPTF